MNNHAECPICGHTLDVKTRAPGSRWSPRQDWLLMRLDELGLPDKLIARVFHTSADAIESRLDEIRCQAA